MIKLLSGVLKHIYTEDVYLIEKRDQPYLPANATTERSDTFGFIGENTNGVLIINEMGKATANEENESAFLTKILQAVNLNLSEAAMITWNMDYQIAEIIKAINPGIILYFAETPLPLFGTNCEKYTILKIKKLHFVCLDPLREIEKNKQKKTLLWQNLQTLFMKV